MRRLREGYDVNDAVIARPQRTGFSPWNPVLQEHGYPSMVPSTGRTTPQGRLHHCHRQWRLTPGPSPFLPHTLDLTVARFNHDASTRKSPAQPATPPRHHQQAPNSPRPHHQGGAGPASPPKRSTTILPKSSLLARSSRPRPATATPQPAAASHRHATAGRSPASHGRPQTPASHGQASLGRHNHRPAAALDPCAHPLQPTRLAAATAVGAVRASFRCRPPHLNAGSRPPRASRRAATGSGRGNAGSVASRRRRSGGQPRCRRASSRRYGRSRPPKTAGGGASPAAAVLGGRASCRRRRGGRERERGLRRLGFAAPTPPARGRRERAGLVRMTTRASLSVLPTSITFQCITLHVTFAIQSVGHTSTAHTGEGTDGELEMEQGKRHSGTSEHNSWTGRYL
jgi:hypothetical protein